MPGHTLLFHLIAYLPSSNDLPAVKLKIVVLPLLLITLRLLAQPVAQPFTGYRLNVPGSALFCNMVPIHPGNFLMGSSETEPGRHTDEGPQKKITIGAFWMGALEVTRDEFDVFYTDDATTENSEVDAVTRPSPQYIDFSLGMGKEGGYPVNSLSQYAALMYCRWLYQKTGEFYRLPTEAEWEYACRAGTTTRYYFGNEESELAKYAWYKANSDNKFHKTGAKLPNAWGLYDMLGNLNEWTMDHYIENRMNSLTDNQVNPMVPPGESRYPTTLRGGSFLDEAGDLRIGNRFKSVPDWNRRDPQIPKSKWWLTDAPGVGFRIVKPLDQPDAETANAFYDQYLRRG